MSSNNLRRRRNSWGRAYRLNRAALMRMEEGRRKVSTYEEELSPYLFVEVEDKGGSNINMNEATGRRDSFSPTDNENSLEDEGEEAYQTKVKLKTKKLRNKERERQKLLNRLGANYRERSKPEMVEVRKFYPDDRIRTVKSASGQVWSDLEPLERRRNLSSRRPASPKQKGRVNQKSQSSQVSTVSYRMHSPNISSYGSDDRVINLTKTGVKGIKPRSRSPSPNRKYARRSAQKSAGRVPNVTWAFSDSEEQPSHCPERLKNNETGGVENRVPSPPILRKVINEAANDLIQQMGSKSRKRAVSPTSETLFSEQGRDEFWGKSPTKRCEPSPENIQLHQNLKASTAHNLLGGNSKLPPSGLQQRAKSRKLTGGHGPHKSIAAYRRIVLNSPSSSMPTSPDQKEVISKWRKWLGTSSASSASLNLSSSLLASSSLRDSQIFRVQNMSTKGDKKVSERDDDDISFDEEELQALLGHWSKKWIPNDVLSPSEEAQALLQVDKERKLKKIRYLEELARGKMEQIEVIRRKKRKALEEEVMLNEKLERLIKKIQELRESESFIKLMNKKSQIHSAKKLKTIKKTK